MFYQKVKKNINIFECIVGSTAYGTNTPDSDIDVKSVFLSPVESLLSFNYENFIQNNKDDVSYEIKRFIELCALSNPTTLEMLFVPQDLIINKDPLFDILLNNKQKFITKKCKDTFGNYAIQQIKKAKGLDKMMNWENERFIRKDVIDFCYVTQKGKTYKIRELFSEDEIQKIGVIKLDHMADMYNIYFDPYNIYKFKGLASKNGNSLLLSSIPKEIMDLGRVLYFNKSEYSKHCKEYKNYQDWLKNRNTQRYVDTTKHGQKYDGKNLLHCRRLIDTVIEILREGKLNVSRPNAEYLLSIRHGEMDLESIISKAEEDIILIEELYEKSSLPEDVDKELCNDILYQIRSKQLGIKY